MFKNETVFHSPYRKSEPALSHGKMVHASYNMHAWMEFDGQHAAPFRKLRDVDVETC